MQNPEPLLAEPTQTSTNHFAERFFDQAFATNCLVHAYVLKGPDLAAQYALALSVAQRLNCLTPMNNHQACNACRTCKWILDNAHPAVMTISRLTSLSEDSKDKEATTIKGEQISQLIRQLATQSQETRVVIFTDAEVIPEGGNAPNVVLAPYEWRSRYEDSGQAFQLKPLNQKVLNATAGNRFLKTLEEPPQHTLFFFLTDTEESLLTTITSRCQVVPVAARKASTESCHGNLFTPLAAQLWQGHLDAETFTTTFNNILTEAGGLTPIQGLEQLQQCVAQFGKQPDVLEHPKTYQHYVTLQKRLEKHRHMLTAHVQPKYVLQQVV